MNEDEVIDIVSSSSEVPVEKEAEVMTNFGRIQIETGRVAEALEEALEEAGIDPERVVPWAT